jgi:hypothetical protein
MYLPSHPWLELCIGGAAALLTGRLGGGAAWARWAAGCAGRYPSAAGGESFMHVHWVAVPKALRARRVNRWRTGSWASPSCCSPTTAPAHWPPPPRPRPGRAAHHSWCARQGTDVAGTPPHTDTPRLRARVTPSPPQLHVWVRVEIMGAPTCRIVGESQSVLRMIDPMISLRSR